MKLAHEVQQALQSIGYPTRMAAIVKAMPPPHNTEKCTRQQVLRVLALLEEIGVVRREVRARNSVMYSLTNT